jgi:hypothetical protein
MRTTLNRVFFTIVLAALAVLVTSPANSQTTNPSKAGAKAGAAKIVRVMNTGKADTAIATTGSGKMDCCAKKDGADKSGADKSCTDKSCCSTGKDGGHSKADMKEMHGRMDKKEMKSMHEKMMKEKEDKDAGKSEKKEGDKDDDDDLLP